MSEKFENFAGDAPGAGSFAYATVSAALPGLIRKTPRGDDPPVTLAVNATYGKSFTATSVGAPNVPPVAAGAGSPLATALMVPPCGVFIQIALFAAKAT